MTLHKFKSFKHAELLFSNGFTCVVGPNGSGKSNICDALLFGLGESSLRRLRASKLDSLITLSGSKSHELRKAYVKIELGGDENIAVTRAVRSDGKSLYRLNGKRMTRQEVLEVIMKHGIHADETNTITQGEINRLIELSPKGRRELIDIASGIEEFERKKEESMKELEKVSQKISEAQIMLDERMGFLKELEAEKAAAEKFLEFSSRLKVLNYSTLIAKKNEAESMLSEHTKSMAITDSKKNETAYKLETIAKKIEELNGERQRLTKDLGESAKAMGEINAKLEAAKMELAKLELHSTNSLNLVSEAEKAIKALEAESVEAGEKVKKNMEEVDALAVKISEIGKTLAKKEISTKGISTDVGNVDELNTIVKNFEAETEELNGQILEIMKEASGVGSSKESMLKSIKELEDSLERLLPRRTETVKKEKDARARTESLNAEIKKSNSEIASLSKEIESSDEGIIKLREQRAVWQPRGGMVHEKIKEKFGKDKGFYGKVSDLCGYESKYAYAVEAAAGARFDYIAVDSIDTANEIIRYLKSNNLGRATFIPIKELIVAGESGKEKNATQLISVIETDDKFSKVFNFIFSNTYLVEESDEAKRLGLGKHRYVTISGEVIEQSGVISGGAQQKRVSTASIEKEIKELTEKSVALKKRLADDTSRLEKQRKELAYSEMEVKSIEKEVAYIGDEIRKFEKEKSALLGELKKLEGKESELLKELESKKSEKAKSSRRLEEAREELSAAYNKTMELSKSLAKYGLSKEELERLEELRKESETLKISKAELQKENQMLEQKMAGLKKDAASKAKEIEALKKSIKENKKKEEISDKEKRELESKINSDNDLSKGIYTKISGLDTEIAKLSNEHNKANTELANMERQLSDIKMRRSQAETRINDLNAELAIYKEEIKPAKEDVSAMEKEAIVLNSKISELGNVNLKAPEAFSEKKKNADEALDKVNTLESERQAVLRMIQEIDSKKLQTFMSTLNDVAKNFTRLYNYIFPGNASIRLENPKEPFDSGLEIVVMKDKSARVINSMSGGEKSLLSLILIFSIHMCKPSSLYIFDEVDAALDKENSRKLSQLIKEMSKNAQFIVVSHNDSLIANADTAIGVAKSNDESKALGIEISNILNKKK